MVSGRVKWFNDKKGWGFIVSYGNDYFVYFKDIVMPGRKTLKDGAVVMFEPEMGSRGRVAKKVSVLYDEK